MARDHRRSIINVAASVRFAPRDCASRRVRRTRSSRAHVRFTEVRDIRGYEQFTNAVSPKSINEKSAAEDRAELESIFSRRR